MLVKDFFKKLYIEQDKFLGRYVRFAVSRLNPVKPPKQIPSDLIDDFTMNNRIGIEYWYFNNAYSSFLPRVFKRSQIDSLLSQIRNNEATHGYKFIDPFLHEALRKYSVRNVDVAILGSRFPWYESICLHYGGNPTTIEYNRIVSDDKRLRLITPEEYDSNPVLFDSAFSISSFEHDGLGRYGDPLKPDGDLLAMKKMRKMLKKGGLLFLSVPVGIDKLVWNAHRIYGQVRLPCLLEKWKLLESFGFEETMLNMNQLDNPPEPIFVLRNS
jgi:hypothetical protein